LAGVLIFEENEWGQMNANEWGRVLNCQFLDCCLIYKKARALKFN